MKKTFSLVLAALLASAALVSCAATTPRTAVNANIRVTSSDAESAAAWLTARLGDKLNDRVVIGTDTDGFGVDVSALEADGYVIRALGDEVALFARTAGGLDRAVRAYAKAVESGEAVADETYHEGSPVKRLTVAGADISTFSVRVEGPRRDGDVTGLRDRIESTVVPAIAPLIGRLCGASLADEESAEHFIVFRPVTDRDFTEGDFRYAVENGDLVFEYAELLGAKQAVQTFFEDECGWKNLNAGLDYIEESDGVDIPFDLDVTADPLLDGILIPTAGFGLQYRNSAYSDLKKYRPLYNPGYRIPHACNGWLNYRWGGYDVEYSQPCMSDENVLQYVTDSIFDYIEEKVAGGAVIGYDLNSVDVAHGDNGSFCMCKKCLRVYAEEGSVAGASVRFANAIWESLDAEGYGLLKVVTYAYLGNHEPCKTRPLDNVWITFCADFHCTIHPLDGSKCFEDTHPDGFGSREYADWIRGWAALTDNLYVWDYDLDYNIHPFICVEQIWDDLHFLSESGATRMYWQCRYHGLGIIELEAQLMQWLNMHPKAEKSDYYDEYHYLLSLHYGDAWNKVAEAFSLWEEAEMQSGNCCGGWLFSSAIDTDQMNYAYYAENCWEKILSLLEDAEKEVKSAEQLSELELVRACHLYHGCLAYYFVAYETQDEDLMTVLEERYAEMLSLLRKNGKNTRDMEAAYARFDLHENIHEMAWDAEKGWYRASPFPGGYEGEFRERLLGQFGIFDESVPLRDAPEEYAEG